MNRAINKPLANLPQSFSAAEKAQARANIDAASAADVQTITDNVNTLGESIASESTQRESADSELSRRIDSVPSPENGVLSIYQDGDKLADFSANQSSDVSVSLKSGNGTTVKLNIVDGSEQKEVAVGTLFVNDVTTDNSKFSQVSITDKESRTRNYWMLPVSIGGVPVLGNRCGKLKFGEHISSVTSENGDLTIDAAQSSLVEYSGALGAPDRGPADVLISTNRNGDRYQTWSLDADNGSNHGTFYLFPNSVEAGLVYQKDGRFSPIGLANNVSIVSGSLHADVKNPILHARLHWSDKIPASSSTIVVGPKNGNYDSYSINHPSSEIEIASSDNRITFINHTGSRVVATCRLDVYANRRTPADFYLSALTSQVVGAEPNVLNRMNAQHYSAVELVDTASSIIYPTSQRIWMSNANAENIAPNTDEYFDFYLEINGYLAYDNA